VGDLPVHPSENDDNYFHGDWETLEMMPTPDGFPLIPAPWRDGANCKVADDIRFDYKKADGWEWSCGTFSSTLDISPRYFCLYNKFRGLMRFYYYADKHQIDDTSLDILTHKLTVAPGESSILNFADQFIIDVNSNSVAASAI
jgi:hypothetical protein